MMSMMKPTYTTDTDRIRCVDPVGSSGDNCPYCGNLRVEDSRGRCTECGAPGSRPQQSPNSGQSWRWGAVGGALAWASFLLREVG